ncbi:hypothetical protein BVRB_5g109960 [Beta vulgaris subsp. vulgaris]|uniref:nucleolin 2 isoform X2 n=1 Tax=Beta vulgaris subsp. vulgaris TaxID=3555 RepID=UPI00053F2C0A|nr:nucleolin 2 isoform X2 [Beta vulgaris subsp. vulgaris]KMT11315.1 hypothetical protein BVRB_5g109960 [Beta vulgaris subsp. vulgaris]
MPPRGRPRRAAAQKAALKPSTPPTEPAAEENTVKEQPLVEASSCDVVLGTSSESLISGTSETVSVHEDDVVLETLAPVEDTVKGDGVVVVADGGASIASSSGNVGKVKKVVKKTVKVVKKVIKKVPRKVVKDEVAPKGDQFDKASGDVNSMPEAISTIADDIVSIGDQLKVENHVSDGLASVKVEEGEKEVEEDVIKKVPRKVVEEEIVAKSDQLDKASGDVDSISNTKSTFGDGLVSISDQLKVEDHDSEGLVSVKVEEGEKEVEVEVKVEEKKDDLEGVFKGNSEGVKESELMEVDNAANNEGVVEERGGECGKEGVHLGKEEEREGEEGKLFRGELEAMERRKRRKTEIFIGRLDKDAKEEDIRKVYGEAGHIVDLRMMMNSKTGKQFAFLRYSSAEEAKRALEKFAKVEICGKECGASPAEGNDTIFLGNIDKKWKDEDVVKLLNKIGIDKIDKVTVMINPNNRECNRGFAFVEFETIKDAQVAYTKLQEKGVSGKNQRLKVAWAEPLKELDEEEMLKVKTVYAEFIPSSWDEEKVRDSFKKFGEIDDVVLARNLKTSKRKDFAFIRYKTRVAAIGCIESFGHELRDEDGTKVNVKVSLAKPMTKGKKKTDAHPVVKEAHIPKPKTIRSKVRPSDQRYRTQPNVPHYGIQIPEMSSTNVELVRLLREQASGRPPHASLRNSPMDVHYSSPLSGRKRQFSLLETDPLSGDFNRYHHSRLDASYAAANSSHNRVPPSGLTSPMAYHQRHTGYPSGSLYGGRHYAYNAEIRDNAHESSFLYRRY